MEDSVHDAASHHLPIFITAPGDTDWLLVLMAIILIGSVLAAGVFFFWLHSLPERMVHNKVQFDIVAVLALLSLFTHIHAFWVAALLIALIEFPRFSLPDISNTLGRIAGSLETIADTSSKPEKAKPFAPAAKPTTASEPRASGTSGSTHGNEPAKKREAGHA